MSPVTGVVVGGAVADLAAALGIVLFVVVMAVASGRLLGIRTNPLLALVASVVGCAAGIAGAEAVDRTRVWPQVALSVLFGALGTMIVVIVIEALASPRAGRRARRGSRRLLLHPIAWIRSRLSPLTRSWEVVQHARQRGLAHLRFASPQGANTPEFGRRLRLTLEDSGGMFVKFGQIASTRTDLLGEAMTSQLAGLRSAVRPIEADQLRPLIESELGEPVEQAFAELTWEPMAAASIGQTHRAVLPSGERVVVKVQRPGMEELMARDATVLRLVTTIAERRLPAARRLGARGLAEELILGLEQELDYLREAAMSDRLRTRAGGAVRVPAVHHELSTARLLVMEEARGATVDRPGALEGVPAARPELARSLLRTFLTQVLEDGVYHADPHPGNVMVDDEGHLWLLDFGAVGLLDPGSRHSLGEMTLGLTIGEPVIVARAVRALSGNEAVADTDVRQLQAEIGLLMVESSTGGFDPRMIRQVLSVMNRHGMPVPRAVTQLSRALLTLDGTLQIISPNFDLQRESTVVMRELHPSETEASGDILQDELIRALPMLRTLPEHADELALQLRAGRLNVRTEHYAGRDEVVATRFVDRAVVALIGVGGTLSSALLLLGSSFSRSRDLTDALRAIGFGGLVSSAVLLLRSVAQVLQRDRQAPS